MNSLFTTLLTGFGVLFFLMCLLWLINIRTKNAAIVDVGWGNGFALATLLYFLMSDGYVPRQVLILLMVIFWGERLTLHLLVDRILANKPEDGRYIEMRRKWKTSINLKFFFFFQFQTVLVILLSLPFLMMMRNTYPGLQTLEYTGLFIWFVGLIGESIADAQLKKFKDHPANKGKTCRVGLWSYSRHPNYFFEWIIWVGYAVTALASPYGWLGILSAAVMYYILLNVTGIPLTEEQAMRTRGDDYREYQRTTNKFIPWKSKVS